MYAGVVLFIDDKDRDRETVIFRETIAETRDAIDIVEKIATSKGWTLCGSYIETDEEYLKQEDENLTVN